MAAMMTSSGTTNVRCAARIKKELEKWDNTGEFALSVGNPTQWFVDFHGAAGTIYAGEYFRLQITFIGDYPMEAPEVMFVLPHCPIHPHIYSNGHICLNILGEDWSPALTVRSICVSILSMLSSCPCKERPTDNDRYVTTKKGTPKTTQFQYHDDGV